MSTFQNLRSLCRPIHQAADDTQYSDQIVEGHSPEMVAERTTELKEKDVLTASDAGFYAQPLQRWGTTETVQSIFQEAGIPSDITATVIGGYTGEFAESLRDYGTETIFTDPQEEWVSQAAENRFETIQAAASQLPASLIARTNLFATFECYPEYKAKAEGIEVVEVSEEDTSKTCSVCGREDGSQRVERGLYVCESCDAAFNADVNGAENIRLDINEESNSESASSLDGDRSTGWLAQPGVYLYDLTCGFQPQAEVVDSKP